MTRFKGYTKCIVVYVCIGGAWWLSGKFGALHPEGHRLEGFPQQPL